MTKNKQHSIALCCYNVMHGTIFLVYYSILGTIEFLIFKWWRFLVISIILFIVAGVWEFGMKEVAYKLADLFIDILDGLFTILSDIWNYTVGQVASGLNSAVSFLSGGSASIPTSPIPSGASFLSNFAMLRTLNGLSACGELDTAALVFTALIRDGISPRLCPIARYLFPMPLPYSMFMAVMGSLIDDPTPYPGNNCNIPEDNSSLCIGCQFYLILFACIPILLFTYLLECFKPAIREAIRVGWNVWLVLRSIVHFICSHISPTHFIMEFGSDIYITLEHI